MGMNHRIRVDAKCFSDWFRMTAVHCTIFDGNTLRAKEEIRIKTIQAFFALLQMNAKIPQRSKKRTFSFLPCRSFLCEGFLSEKMLNEKEIKSNSHIFALWFYRRSTKGKFEDWNVYWIYLKVKFWWNKH